MLRRHGVVAQLVEQRTENPRVVGSIPTLATIFYQYPSKTNDCPIESSLFIGLFKA
jgi:hypothetical protein